MSTNGKTICTLCNYIYDEASDESTQTVLRSMKFDNLSEEWCYPECGSAKEMFQPCTCASLPVYEQTCVADSTSGIATGAVAVNVEPAVRKTMFVGELVAQRQSRACVLEQYGIDYCCGGKSTLEDVCLEKGVRVEEVLEKLIASDREVNESIEPDWTRAPLKDLVDHIITTYHWPLRQELSRIAQLAEKVARVHGDNHPEMIEVLNVFKRFKAQLELHMQKEEMVLFPGITAMEATGSPQIFGCGGGVEHPIEVMTQEHEDAGEALFAMRGLTRDYTEPEDACSTYKVLLYALAQFELEMHQHVHKENNILFPRALELRRLVQTSQY